MTEENPLSELHGSLREAVERLTSVASNLSEPPADLDQQVLLQIKQADAPPAPSIPRSEGEFGTMKIVLGVIVASLLLMGTIFGGALSMYKLTSAPSFDGMKFPKETVQEFAELQIIRDEGRQAEVEYLSLASMPELVDSPYPPGATFKAEDVPHINLNHWRPDRDEKSNRLAFLSEFEDLKGLDVMDLYLTHSDLETIAELQNLEKLSLYGVWMLEKDSARHMTWTDIAKLKSLSKLKELDLSNSRFEGCGEYLAELPNFEALYIGTVENVNDRSLSELKVLPKLSKLAIGVAYHPKAQGAPHTVSDIGLESFKQFPALKELLIAPFNEDLRVPFRKVRRMLPKVRVKETDHPALLRPYVELDI